MSEEVDQTWTPPADSGGTPSTPRVLTGRYLLEERIASGGMASVWRAHDEVLARTVAVKILHDHLAADDGFRERFRREAVSAAKLAHPGVVSLYDTGVDGDYVYLVMEYVEGSTLKDLVIDQAPLPVSEVATIGEQVARALDYAHSRGLVHRDVKPANILIGVDGQVKVTDFGIAKAEAADDLTKTGMVLGTAAYVAPEQIRGGAVDGKTDQYSLGIVLYEALTGQQPFKAETPVAAAAQRLERDPLPVRSLRTDVPRGLDAVLMRALCRQPEDRYPSTAQLADDLAEYAVADLEATAALVAPAPAPAAPEDESAAGEEPFLRAESRWLVPVLALLAVAFLLVGAGLGTGVLETRDGFPVGLARDDSGAEGGDAADPVPVEIAELHAFDPQGDQRERDGGLSQMLDDDEETFWRTEHYRSAPFGNFKDGVGFYLDLGETLPLHTLRLVTTTPGVELEVRVADEPAGTLDGWERAGSASDTGEDIEVDLDGVRARYVLVWLIGELPPSPYREGQFAAAFSSVSLAAERG